LIPEAEKAGNETQHEGHGQTERIPRFGFPLAPEKAAYKKFGPGKGSEYLALGAYRKEQGRRGKAEKQREAKGQPVKKTLGGKYGGVKLSERRTRTRRALMSGMRKPRTRSATPTPAIRARTSMSIPPGTRAAKPRIKTALEITRRKTSLTPAESV
jgi:hypothetical protein